jgi:hypothetical protein
MSGRGAVGSHRARVALTQAAHALDGTRAELYATGAGMLAVFLLVALPWIDMAPDGPLRRRSR